MYCGPTKTVVEAMNATANHESISWVRRVSNNHKVQWVGTDLVT